MTVPPASAGLAPAWHRAFLRLQIFIAAIGIMCVVTLVWKLAAPNLGFDESVAFDGQRTVAEVDPGGPAERAGIRVGDHVLEDPGGAWPVAWSERELGHHEIAIARAVERGAVPFKIERGGQPIDVVIVPGPPSVRAAVRRGGGDLFLYVMAAAFFGMAALLAKRPARDDPARRLAAYGLAACVPAFTQNGSWSEVSVGLTCWGYLCVNAGATACSTLLARFAWSFPQRSPLVKSPLPTAALATLAAAACTCSVLECWQIVRTPLPGNRAQILFDCLAFVLIIVGLVWQRRRARTVIARRQASVLLAPFVLATAALFGILAWEHATAGVANNRLVLRGLFLLTAAVPLGFAAATARFRLFDLDAIAPRAGVYGLVAAVSLSVYALVIATADRLLRPLFGPGSEVARWITVPALVIAGAPARRLAERAMDRFLGRDPRRLIVRSTELVATLGGRGAAARIEALIARALEVDVVAVAEVSAIAGDGAGPLADELRRRGAMRVVEHRDPEVVDRLLAAGFEVLVDVPDHGRVIAMSSPLATRTLGDAERHAMVQVGRAVAGALAQQMAQAAIVRDAESARRQIAMDLHDGVGATLAAAQLFAQLAKRRPDHASSPSQGRAADPFGALERTLQDGLADLRLAVWSLADDAGTWDQLVARVRRHMGDVCASAGLALDLSITADLPEEPGAAVRLALLRLLQEALNNVIRHAHAKRVACRVSFEDGAIRVEIEDDGVGLPPEGARRSGRGLGNMARRMEALGGTFTSTRSARGGLRIEASIPIGGSVA